MPKRLILFNHKGGVSKTTTVYNIGWMLSKQHRVLLVDADPQCNLSSLLLRDTFEQYYLDAPTRQHNIKDGVSAAFSGRPSPIAAVDCFSPARSPNLHLLAGHANLSEYDAALTFAQNSNNAIATLQNLPGAFHELIRLVETKYNIDYTIIDLNPGLSAINQNLFLNCDVFVVPTNPDPFSIMALDTLKSILPRWGAWKISALIEFSNSAYPLRPGLPRFGGSLIQRFNVRNGKAARPYRDNIDEIKLKTAQELLPILTRSGMAFQADEYPADLRSNEYCLSEIPDFGGLLPKGHDVGVPIFELTDTEINETGPVLAGLRTKRDQLRTQFQTVVNYITHLLDHA